MLRAGSRPGDHRGQRRLPAGHQDEPGRIIGRPITEVFPDRPDPSGIATLRASLDIVRSDQMADTIAVDRYDIPAAGPGGDPDARYWSLVNVPVPGPGHPLAYIVHWLDDVTDYVRTIQGIGGGGQPRGARQGRVQRIEADLLALSQDLQQGNRTLREANESLRGAYNAKKDFLDRLARAPHPAAHHPRLRRVARPGRAQCGAPGVDHHDGAGQPAPGAAHGRGGRHRADRGPDADPVDGGGARPQPHRRRDRDGPAAGAGRGGADRPAATSRREPVRPCGRAAVPPDHAQPAVQRGQVQLSRRSRDYRRGRSAPGTNSGSA